MHHFIIPLLIILSQSLMSCKSESIDLNSTQIDSTYIICPTPLFTESEETQYHVILIVGQSNCYAGTGLDDNIDTVDSRVIQLGRGDNYYKFIPASVPLDHTTAKSEKVGFGPTFLNYYASQLLDKNDSIIVIACGSGGTGFINNYWNPGDRLYKDAIQRTKYVLDSLKNSSIKAILWQQGEADASNEEYQSQLDTFIVKIRNRLNATDIPFLAGGMVPYWVKIHEDRIRNQEIIKDIENRHPLAGYVDPEEPFEIRKVNPDFNMVHYDAREQRELGKRYFLRYLCILEN